MLSNYLIGLREGLEASLIVVLLIAYLVKSERRHLLGAVWTGVAAAVGLSLAVGALLTFGSSELGERAEEIIGGVLSLLAVVLVTWMIFWMARHARTLSAELRGRVDAAAEGGGSLVVVAFLAVAREGLETALFLWAATRSATVGEAGAAAPLAGALLGFVTAAIIGVLIYRGAMRLDLGKFFQWTGSLLVLIAAGVLAYAVHELQEASVLPGEDDLAFDARGLADRVPLVATLIRATFNLRPAMSWLEVGAWTAYVVVVFAALARVRRTPVGTPNQAPERVTAR